MAKSLSTFLALFRTSLILPARAALTAEANRHLPATRPRCRARSPTLLDKPLYQFNELEVDAYLRYLGATEPDLRQRIIHLARKNLGQPYELYLLGEMPFEPYDPQPLYCLGKSDCVVFAEHTYAMAHRHNWPSFMKMLQRLRYRDGHLGVTTPQPLHRGRLGYLQPLARGRDHRPCRRRLGREVLGEDRPRAVLQESLQARRQRAGSKRTTTCICPTKTSTAARAELQDGDFRERRPRNVPKDWQAYQRVRRSRGFDRPRPDGELPHRIHSTVPKVREEPIDEYIARSTKDNAKNDAEGKPRLVGFKFLRLRDKPLDNLREIDGPDAPRVTLPSGNEAEF